jgi:hypothetical protein
MSNGVMKKKHLLFAGSLAIALAVILVAAASSNSSGSDSSRNDSSTYIGPKSITITGITEKTGQVIIELSADDVELSALGGNIISDNSVTVALYDREVKPFTGNGAYFIRLFFYDNSNSNYYRYAEDETSDLYAPNGTNLFTYAINSAVSTIPFSQFYDAALVYMERRE